MSIKPEFIFSAFSGTGTGFGAVFDCSGLDPKSPPVIQITIASSGTVAIQHSLDNINFTQLVSITASDSYYLDPLGGIYRLNVTANGSGVTAKVGPGYTSKGEMSAIRGVYAQAGIPS